MTIIIPKNVSSVNQTTYYWFADAFSDEEVNEIHNYADQFQYTYGTVQTENNEMNIDEIRTSKIKWFEPTNDCAWLYNKIYKLANEANEACFKFRLHYANDRLQYTLYEGDCEGKYDWHMDIGVNENSLRKLSVVLLLTDPQDFDGGELQIFTATNPESIPLKKGSIVFFPSFFLHRVTKVINGNRKSIVTWIGGDHYI